MFVHARGQLVHTASFGSGARTVVGIAGSFGTLEIWEQPFELLSGSYRTVAYDHLGTGETHVSDDLVTFTEQVALVPELLDALGVERCVLAGDSSMGAVAVEVALRAPERVDGVVLVSSGISYVPGADTRRFAHGLRTDPQATLDAFARVCLPEDDVGHLRRWLRDIVLRTGPERAALLVESFYEVDVRDRLPRLAQPALLVHGALDALPSSRVAVASEMAALIADATLEVIPDAGHVPTLSRPREVAAAIDRFARRLSL